MSPDKVRVRGGERGEGAETGTGGGGEADKAREGGERMRGEVRG